jgi:hypothetical protein
MLVSLVRFQSSAPLSFPTRLIAMWKPSLLLIALAGAMIAGCRNVNVVTASYITLDEARAAGAVSGGYLPEGLPPGTRDIREAHDPDSQRHWALFSFPPGERADLAALLQPEEFSVDGQSCDMPGRVEWWPVLLRQHLDAERIRATGLLTYRSRAGDVLYAVNWSQGRAYLWTPDTR